MNTRCFPFMPVCSILSPQKGNWKRHSNGLIKHIQCSLYHTGRCSCWCMTSWAASRGMSGQPSPPSHRCPWSPTCNSPREPPRVIQTSRAQDPPCTHLDRDLQPGCIIICRAEGKVKMMVTRAQTQAWEPACCFAPGNGQRWRDSAQNWRGPTGDWLSVGSPQWAAYPAKLSPLTQQTVQLTVPSFSIKQSPRQDHLWEGDKFT